MKSGLSVNPYILGGIASILIGVIVYFFLPSYTFSVYGIPLSTATLTIVGLVAVYMGLKRK